MSKRDICLFLGSGFSKAVFDVPTQDCFYCKFNEYLSKEEGGTGIANWEYFKNGKIKKDFELFNDIEALMSYYHNLAYSFLANGKEKNGYKYKKLIVGMRVAMAKYYYEKYFKNPIKNKIFNKFEKFINSKDRNKIFVVTTNYDLGIETVLGPETYYYPEVPFFKENDNDESQCVPIYKLHGSINWWEEREWITTGNLEGKPLLKIENHKKLVNYEHNFKPDDWLVLYQEPKIFSPILIPFFYQKEAWLGQRWSGLFNPLWLAAKKQMCDAKEFYFIGVGLPPADHMLPALLHQVYQDRKGDDEETTVITRSKIRLFEFIKKHTEPQYKINLYNEGLDNFLSILHPAGSST